MLEVTYENFARLLSEKLTIEQIRKKDSILQRCIDKIKSSSNVYIWPSGIMGQKVFSELKANGYENLFVIDRNANLQRAISPVGFIFNPNDVLIISTLTHSHAIYHLAEEMQCKNIMMYYNIKELGEVLPIVFPDDFHDKNFEELLKHLMENTERYKNMYFFLEDEVSKKAFLNNMFFRLTLDVRYTFDYDKGIQYFDDSIVDFNFDGAFIDAGGYNGDTLEDFLSLNKPFRSYYLFEPVKDLLEQAKAIAQDKRIDYINKGLFSKCCTLRFNQTTPTGVGGRIIENEADIEDNFGIIDVVSIDEYIKEKVSFIKMDIEGAELEALKGAGNTIIRDCPTLAICIYHKPTDYLDIFEYINSLNQNYKFFIRHYRDYYAETVLYAVCKCLRSADLTKPCSMILSMP